MTVVRLFELGGGRLRCRSHTCQRNATKIVGLTHTCEHGESERQRRTQALSRTLRTVAEFGLLNSTRTRRSIVFVGATGVSVTYMARANANVGMHKQSRVYVYAQPVFRKPRNLVPPATPGRSLPRHEISSRSFFISKDIKLRFG